MHDPQVRSSEEQVFDLLDRFVVDLGAVLAPIKASMRPGGWRKWAEFTLPMSLGAAERSIAAFLALERLPESVLEALPRPWSAIFSRSAPPAPRKARAKPSERPIHAARGHSSPDLVAATLLSLDSADLNPDLARELASWLESGIVSAS